MNKAEFLERWTALDGKARSVDGITDVDSFVEWVFDMNKGLLSMMAGLAEVKNKLTDYERCRSSLSVQRNRANSVKVGFMYVDPVPEETPPSDSGNDDSNIEGNEKTEEGGDTEGEEDE